jgi:hypothetical protein
MAKQNSGILSYTPEDLQKEPRLPVDLRKTIWFFMASLGVGLFASIMNARNVPACAISILWMLASLSFGILIGFLFGIPKVLQNNTISKEVSVPANSAAVTGNESLNYRQQPNTNLTEISDWLTKIIVGLGLINLKKFPLYVKQVAGWMATGINPRYPSDEIAFCIAMISGFTILGFLFGYLTTRLFLAGAFYRADTSHIDTLISQSNENKAAIDVLNVNQNVMKEKIYSPSTYEEKFQINMDKLTGLDVKELKKTNPVDNFTKLIQEATEYLQISAPEWGERVRLKDKAAGDMGNFILDNNISREAITKEILANRNEGLLIALATVITLRPEPGDTERVLETGPLATRKHVRYRILLAINTLNQRQLLEGEDRVKCLGLIDSYRTNADQPLLNMIETTLSLVKSNLGY